MKATEEELNKLGWLQCSECGHGHEVSGWDVMCGDVTDRTACPYCCTGICRIDWTYPDGKGWKADI